MAVAEYYVTDAGTDSAGRGLTEGNAYLTPDYALGDIQTTHGGFAGAPIRVWCKGSLNLGAELPVSTTVGYPPSRDAWLCFTGYGSTTGDDLRCSWDCGNNDVHYDPSSSNNFVGFENINFSNWGVSTIPFYLRNLGFVRNNEFDGTGSYGRVAIWGNNTRVLDNDFVNIAGASNLPICTVNSAALFERNTVKMTSGSGYGISAATGSKIINNVILVQSSDGVRIEGTDVDVLNNSIIAQVTGTNRAGVKCSSSARDWANVLSNYIEGFVGSGSAGVDLNSSTGQSVQSNRFFNNLATTQNLGDTLNSSDNDTVAASGLVDWSSADYKPTQAMVDSALDRVVAGADQRAPSGKLYPRGFNGGFNQ